jgi:hypothetical protein
VDPGLYGCIAALVWVLHRHGMAVPHHVARHRRLGPRYRRALGLTRIGVVACGTAVFAVAVANVIAPALPGAEGAALYLAGVSTALAVLVAVEAALVALRIAVAREAVRAAARRDRARSVRTMMRLGLGPRSEQLF